MNEYEERIARRAAATNWFREVKYKTSNIMSLTMEKLAVCSWRLERISDIYKEYQGHKPFPTRHFKTIRFDGHDYLMFSIIIKISSTNLFDLNSICSAYTQLSSVNCGRPLYLIFQRKCNDMIGSVVNNNLLWTISENSVNEDHLKFNLYRMISEFREINPEIPELDCLV
jgi:hypothetical protein